MTVRAQPARGRRPDQPLRQAPHPVPGVDVRVETEPLSRQFRLAVTCPFAVAQFHVSYATLGLWPASPSPREASRHRLAGRQQKIWRSAYPCPVSRRPEADVTAQLRVKSVQGHRGMRERAYPGRALAPCLQWLPMAARTALAVRTRAR